MKYFDFLERHKVEQIAEDYCRNTSLPLMIADLDGEILFESNPYRLSDELKLQNQLEPFNKEWRRKAVEGSFHWGEAYFSSTPLGLIGFAVPVIHAKKHLGALISGFVIFPEMKKDIHEDINEFISQLNIDSSSIDFSSLNIPVTTKEKIREYANLLLNTAQKNRFSDIQIIKERKERITQQQHIAGFLENLKQAPKDVTRMIVEKQDEIIGKIKLGDITNAKEILNQFLASIFLESGLDFNLVKIRIIELVIIISRSAIEFGVDSHELLGEKYSNLTRLNEIDDFEELCQNLSRLLENYIKQVASSKVKKKKIEFKKILEHVDHNFYDKISAEDIAEISGLSQSRALHLFKEETGLSLRDYVKKRRIEYSKYLLEKTNKDIADISIECGFFDQSHFSKQFKSLEKLTPMQYRKLIKL